MSTGIALGSNTLTMFSLFKSSRTNNFKIPTTYADESKICLYNYGISPDFQASL